MRSVAAIAPLTSGRYLITLDDETSFPLYGQEMYGYGIEEEKELSDAAYAEIMMELLPKRARMKAMYLLQAMDRTESQLRQKLTACQYPPDIIEEAVEYVRAYHYIDDVRYALNYIEYRKASKSMRQLAQELYQKGISREDFAAAAEQIEAPDEDLQIRAWMEKKRFCAAEADRKETDRFISFLLRKGYGLAAIRRALREE